ncbi:phage tail assembly protein [Pseudomonas kribbensis]|uniref:phage tail assembly protein n=1 Tax=Pseudomonas kribbensis TaxID=1628086 RepID=UPI003D77F638
MADALTFTLKFAFTSTNGEQLSTLPTKRLKRKDISAAQAVTKDEGAMEDLLVAKLLGNTLATEVLREMAAGRALAPVLGRSTAAGVEVAAV